MTPHVYVRLAPCLSAGTPLLLGPWIPGASPPPLPAGFGYKLPRGAVLVVEMHYAGDRDNAMPINDQSHWGIRFASGPVKPFSSHWSDEER